VATLKQIDNQFNDNFMQRSGPGNRAKIEDLGEGNFRATYKKKSTEFPVPPTATVVQLVGITKTPAERLWQAVRKTGA
jgi:hypothetical protein